MLHYCISSRQSSFSSADWAVYKADSHSNSYSVLDQINKDNVDQLEVAWTFRTDDINDKGYSTMETNPIIIDGVLYGVSPRLSVFAINAQTGKKLWMYAPLPDTPPRGHMRAVSYWTNGSDKRILFSAGTYLFAINAETGNIIKSFGNKGRVNLNKGLNRDPSKLSVKSPSPGIIYGNLIIMGSAVGEDYGSPPGYIRAYDVLTGEIKWTFHTIPQPGEPGYDTWKQARNRNLIPKGGVNNWAGMSLDQERGIVYVPLGSPTYDFYGGDRPGKNLYANSLVALDAATGKLKWHYQTVHHDLWDYDLSAPPNLVTIKRNGREIDAVAQVTKTGFTFVFDRDSGKPVFNIEERPVPASNMENEKAWPTQPFPTASEPFIRHNFTEEDITTVSSSAHDSVLVEFHKYRHEGFFIPPSKKGTIYFPATLSGASWGGAAFDPKTNILYINASERPQIAKVRKTSKKTTKEGSPFEQGRLFFKQQCATCHGANLEGQQLDFSSLNNNSSINDTVNETESNRLKNITAYRGFDGPNGYPAIKPPWGTLNAIDLNTGKVKWKIPLGTYPELIKKGVRSTGSQNYGGPIVTAEGLIFIGDTGDTGDTGDKRFKAFDKDTGELLWEMTLPTGGFATPSTYMVDGKQYVVIAAGGGHGTKPSDYYIAFALPETSL